MKVLMLILWTVAAVAGIRWTAVVGDDKEAVFKKELEKFAGTCQPVAAEKDGVKEPEADLKQTKVIFNGDKFTMERAGKMVEEGWICIDPTRKPKVIDVYARESKVVMSIYEWDGADKIRLCGTHPGTEQTRPKLFSTTKGSGHVMFVIKRERAK